MIGVKRENHMADGVHATTRGASRPQFPHAASVEGGRQIFVSGQLPYNASGEIVAAGDMPAQYVQVAENIKAVLEQAGAGLADIVKMNTFVTDMAAYFACREQRTKYFGPGWPTSTTVEVRKLADPDAMIEIDVVAVVSS